MDASKQAVRQFLAKDGQNDTTVHETVAPAVIHEHVVRTEHEEIVTAVEREVHQDHYHTSIQPIQDREILPEVHEHVMKPVVQREFHHGDDGKILQGIEAERAMFKNTREVGELQHTYAEAPVVAAEHVHHHVYETIQPVVEKEVLQHTVHHTVIPIHEVVKKEAVFEGVSALKPLTMAEFQASGGVLGPHGKNANIDHFATGTTTAAAAPATSSASSRETVPANNSTATSRALESATARTSGHTRAAEGTGSISNLETKTERKFPLATGEQTAQTLPIRSANANNAGNTVTSPTTTTTTTTRIQHSSSPAAPVNATPRGNGISNNLTPAATPEAKRGDASLTAANQTTASTASPVSSRKSVDASRRSMDTKARQSTEGRRSGEHDNEKKEGLLKRIMHKLE